MKITKKPKSVEVYWDEMKYVSYVSEYQCPSCGTLFRGTLDGIYITRFHCDCGQELIVIKK